MKKILSLAFALLMLVSVLAVQGTAFAANTPFDDDDVVINVPYGPDNEPVDVVATLSDSYDVIEDGLNSSNPNAETTNKSNSEGGESSGGGNLESETLFTNTFANDSTIHTPDTSTEDKKDIIPEDSFDGNYSEVKGSDGSVTKVYDNGSVVTTKPDGTKEGVTYSGHRVTEDKDGNQTGYFFDGSTVVYKSDGTSVYTDTEGGKEIFNADGTHYGVHPTGYNIEYDENDNVKSIYYDNGQRINLYDKDGNIVTGEQTITGDNGETVTYKFEDGDEDGNYLINEISITSSGNGKEYGFTAKATDDGGFKVDAKNLDGSSMNFEINEDKNTASFTRTNADGSAQLNVNQKDNQFSMSYKDNEINASIAIGTDGGSMSFSSTDGTNIEVKTDENGEPVTASLTNADGSFMKADGNNCEVKTEKGSCKIENGKITDLKLNDDEVFNGSYNFNIDQKGIATGVYVNNDDGTKIMWTHDKDGNLVIMTPNDEITVDENGNVFRNGEPVLFDGAQINVNDGFDTSTTEESTTEAEPLIEQICGTYEMTGQSVVETDGQTITNNREFTVDVSDAGDGKVAINITMEKGDEINEVAALEEGNKKAIFSIADTPYVDCYIAFDVSGGTVNANLHMGANNEDATKWYTDLSGTKS